MAGVHLDAADGFFTVSDTVKVVKHLLIANSLEGGKVTDFRGGYEDWLAKKAREEELKNVLKPQSKQARAQERKEKRQEKRAKKQPGGTKMLEKQRNAAEREIAKAEAQLEELAQAIDRCGADYQKMQELAEEQAAREAELEQLYQRWEELSLQIEGAE